MIRFNSSRPFAAALVGASLVLLVACGYLFVNGRTIWRADETNDTANRALEGRVSQEVLPSGQEAVEDDLFIAGYGGASSVKQGQSISFHVSTSSPVYDIQIYRDNANGREFRTAINNLSGTEHTCEHAMAVVVENDTAPVGCNWPIATAFTVPVNWPSGMYVANLLVPGESPNGYGAYIFFVVLEDQPGSTSSALVVMPTTTWQAYNQYGGMNLYDTPQSERAVKVTFDRPYKECRDNCPYDLEIPLVGWLESEGYVVEYAASEDIHNDSALLFNYQGVILPGHDEYWSKEMRDNVDAYLGAGGNLAVLGANSIFRQIRLEDDDRTLIGYKSDWRQDPLYGVDNSRVTTDFRREPVNRPQNTTIGLGWTGWVNHQSGNGGVGRYTAYRTEQWPYEGTELNDEDVFWVETEIRVEVDGTEFIWEDGLPNVTGWEGTPSNFQILGLEPSFGGALLNGYATMGYFIHPGGGVVFHAANYGWLRGLRPENNPQGYQTVRQITRNVLNRMQASVPVPTPAVTNTPTNTPVPTETSVPTETPVSTETPIPTEIPASTEIPVSTETPIPTDVPAPVETSTTVLTVTPSVATATSTPSDVATAPPSTETPLPSVTPSPTSPPSPTETAAITATPPVQVEPSPTIAPAATPANGQRVFLPLVNNP